MADSTDIARELSDLSFVQRGFLALMRGAEKIGAADTSTRLYNDVVQRGRRSPITEADFSPDQLAAISQLVDEKSRKTGQATGHIDYADYPGGNLMVANRPKAHGEIMNSLGGFNYSATPNQPISVTDTYDFNTNRGGAGEDNMLAQIAAALFYPRNLAASIGRKIVPPGAGVPVNINIPTQ